MLHRAFEDSFTDLLATWHRYRDAHEDGGALVEIAALRHELDERRRRVRSIRRFLSPQKDELDAVALAAFCPSLDSTVFVPYSGISQAGYECACGSFVVQEAEAMPGEG